MISSPRVLTAIAAMVVTVSLAACSGNPAGGAASFTVGSTPSSTASATASSAASAETTAPANTAAILLDGKPVEQDPRVPVSGTDEDHAGIPFDWAFKDAIAVAAPQTVNLNQAGAANQTAVEQALANTASRLAAKQPVVFLPVQTQMVPPSLVSNPQTGEVQDGNLPLHTMREPIVAFSSKQGIVSVTLIELQSLSRADVAEFDRATKQKRPAPNLAGSFFQEDSLGYTTLLTDGRPDGSALLLRGRTFSANCQPGDLKDCVYINDDQKEGFGLQGKPLVLIQATLQRLDFGTGYNLYDGPFVYVTPLYNSNPATQGNAMDTAHGSIKAYAEVTASRRPVSIELRIMQLSTVPENTAAMSPTALQALTVFARP